MFAGEMRAKLDVLTGGAIAALTWRGLDILRPVRDERLGAQHGRAVAAYPLIPYANRIDRGRFSLDGHSYQLGLNFGDHPHSLHGNGWMRAWSVAEASPVQVRLTLAHRPPQDPAAEWPFAYDAEQIFSLTEHQLSVRNADVQRFPAGLGLHPYVARTESTILGFTADTVWQPGPDSLPVAAEAVPLAQSFDPARPIGRDVLDACFAGWGGRADITTPEHGFTLHIEAAPPLDHFQVYTPRNVDFCGLEPVSNMPDGINRMDSVADQGMKMLAPGEVLTATVTLTVQASR